MIKGRIPLETTASNQKHSIELSRIKRYVSAIVAGAFIAFGAYGALIFGNHFEGYTGKLLGAIIFPVGLIAILMFGLYLFTSSHLYVIGVYEGKYSIVKVLLFWVDIWIGNFIGALLVAMMAFYVNTSNLEFLHYASKIAEDKINLPIGQAFILGIGCNLLVCTAVFMSYQTKETMGKVMVAVYPIVLFIMLGFQHSVANMFYIPLGMINEGFTVQGIYSILIVTLGNIVGGVLFATAIYFIKKEKQA